jgi:hypothetical protein
MRMRRRGSGISGRLSVMEIGDVAPSKGIDFQITF